MKTAMQDVLNLVQKRLNEFDGLKGFEVTMMKQELNWFKDILINNLKKEENQILKAYTEGQLSGIDDNPVSLSFKYYNQTYNQEPKKEYQPSEEYLKKQRELMEDFVWNKMNNNNL